MFIPVFIPYLNLPHLKLLKKEILEKVKEDIKFLKSKKISIPSAFYYENL
jgi:hypothetical protein